MQMMLERVYQVSTLTIFSTFYVLTKIAGRGQETATSKYLTMDGNVLTADRGQETAISKYLTMDGNVLTADRGQETAISKSA